ncbi:MAG TPA: hypothetical protein VFG04_02945 [Planctomycetaceae bacterium]|jgi:hypothetical protein|nr:hypothetical protein [Planctomycetaceae bacterium]
MTVFSGQISQSSDDAGQAGTAVIINNASIQVGGESIGSLVGQAGFRFQGVTIPQGATITAASLTLDFASRSGSPSNSVVGEAADNSATFTTATNNISGRSQTSASATWNMGSITTGNATSPDLSSIIQEIVNRVGWVSGNALSLIIEVPHAPANGAVVVAYDGTPANAAQLSITYGSALVARASDTIGAHDSPSLTALWRRLELDVLTQDDAHALAETIYNRLELDTLAQRDHVGYAMTLRRLASSLMAAEDRAIDTPEQPCFHLAPPGVVWSGGDNIWSLKP